MLDSELRTREIFKTHGSGPLTCFKRAGNLVSNTLAFIDLLRQAQGCKVPVPGGILPNSS